MEGWRHPYPEGSRLDAFRRHVNRVYRLRLQTYDDIHTWSVENLEQFSRATWDFCGIIYSVPPEKVANGLPNMWPRPEWFPGARLNYTENILAAGLANHPDQIALSALREAGTHCRHLTWSDLRHLVAHYASAMRAAGIQKSDRVAAILSNSIEAVGLLLAAGSIGAIFSSTAPDLGASGIVSRYEQIRPKILFVDSEVFYAGKHRVLHKKLATAITQLRQRVPELQKVVTVSGSNSFLKECRSGTTGTPKCICHSGGGALLQQKRELILSTDLNSDSTYYQYTTTGWMMWNFLVGSLSVGSRIVLYDGSPLHPSAAFQVKLLEEQKYVCPGLIPNYMTTEPLESLRYVISSGSPLSSEVAHWFRDSFPKRVGLFSGSGGTDLVAGIINGNPMVEIFDGELASSQLGMNVQVWNAHGCDIGMTGERGDLVITTPFFSMPVCFWGDKDNEKYRKAYFQKFPGVWCHGDFVLKNFVTKGYVILGRSDGVLNPGGIRFGTAEIYAVVDQIAQIEDCIAVGQRRPGENDEQVLLFLKTEAADFDGLQQKVKAAIREQVGPRQVPAYICQVRDIPYTLNGKKIEMVVKSIVCKGKLTNLDSVANPECLEEYAKFADLPLSSEAARL
ncbi:uncharacterized protein B0I36DRAFT_371786 [Microdochium trichocladiopsis]|uniref:Acetoacetyl-CoA synthetase n=1 Tax=Microdochium trichocladiopsis TaxID=1682393 RepID=A0A9P8YFK9_9PEZI|nr:uncharacterized protein B0I36DRAFT_371786 [Microdochium trichocladiopsis]KAH7037080.1 hypothetical protein B0I36DRAFT_371786 [Microdochium trichocladiopsis]